MNHNFSYNETNLISEQHILTVAYQEPIDLLANRFNQIVAVPDTRTLWYKGWPYGTAYQFAKKDSDASGDVFGDVLSHSLNGPNEIVSGTGNVAYTENGAVFGSFNKYSNIKEGEGAYLFCVGNGTDNNNRSNAMTVMNNGDVVAYRLSYTKLDTSYVTSLGESATMDVVLSALLTPAEYYTPSIYFSSSGETSETRNKLVGTSFNDFTVSMTWSSNTKPKYQTEYIYSYIKKNNKFPNGISMSVLGYTNCLVCSNGKTDNYNSNLDYFINIHTSQTETVKVDITYNKLPERDENNLIPIYNGNNNMSFSIGGSTSYTIKGFKLDTDKPGVFYLTNTTIPVYYDTPQLNYFNQLAERGAYTFSDSKAWKTVQSTNVSINIPVYFGYYFIYGIFTSNTNYTDKIPDTEIIDAMNSTVGGSGNLTNTKIFYKIVTCKCNTGYLPTGNSTIYFGKSKMGCDSYSDGKVKYFIIAFPEGYINVTNAESDPIKILTAASPVESPIDTQRTTTIDWTHSLYTNNKNIKYRVFVGKMNVSTIYFGNETSTNENIRVTMNQTGLSGEIK